MTPRFGCVDRQGRFGLQVTMLVAVARAKGKPGLLIRESAEIHEVIA